MTIATGSVATSTDQLRIHNANGYLRLTDAATLTLDSDAIVPTQNYNKVAVQSGTTDTCSSITATNVSEGFVLVLIPANTANTITFTDTATPSSGTLSLNGDFSMTGTDCSLTLIYKNPNWVEISRTPNAGISAAKAIVFAMIFS
jgi:hypothetical protein